MAHILLAIVIFVALGATVVVYVAPTFTPTAPEATTPDKNPIENARDAVQSVSEKGNVIPKASGVVINMSGKGLTSVPKEIFSQTEITTLNLSHNALTGALPAEVRHLSNLKVLDLSDNQFTGVPAEVGQLSELRELDLSNNPITGLPYEIGNLKKLERLDLSGTRYSKQDLEVIKNGLSAEVLIVID
jgi:Leucine-rich repeat (LRR) protein